MRPVLLKIIEAAGALRARAAARVRTALGVADALLLFAAELRAVLLRAATYAGGLAVLGLMALQIVLPQSLVVAEAPLESEWAEIIRPFPAFALIIPEFNGTAGYASWRHTDGGGRKDVLTFGDQRGGTAVVELYRAGAESSPDDGNDITASIAQLRLSSATHVSPDTIETKFGPVIVETFADRAPDGERGCVKFSRAFEEPHFELSGWFCNAGPEMVDRRTIACALDRLTLFGGRSQPRLGALFARAELKRTFCGANSVFVAATPKRQDWLEATRNPRLRGRLTEARF